MPSSRDVQQGVSDFTHILGLGLMYAGAGALFVMAIVGTISIDLVILAYAERHHNSFLTAYIWFSLFTGGNGHHDPIPLLIASPITSIIAIALSFALGVSGVGIGIAIGWGVAFGILALGFIIDAIAEAIKPAEVQQLPPSGGVAQPQAWQASANGNSPGFFQAQQPSAPVFGAPPPYEPPSENGYAAFQPAY